MEVTIEELLKRALPAGRRDPAILISGSTDAALLEVVQAACTDAGVQPVVTALDICATPLALMEAFADQAGLALHT